MKRQIQRRGHLLLGQNTYGAPIFSNILLQLNGISHTRRYKKERKCFYSFLRILAGNDANIRHLQLLVSTMQQVYSFFQILASNQGYSFLRILAGNQIEIRILKFLVSRMPRKYWTRCLVIS
jgi:hypothetical protein